MNLLLARLKKRLVEELDFQGNVVIGGSHFFGEESEYSDTDYYIIARSVFELLKLLKRKKDIVKIKKELGIDDIVLLMSKGLFKYKWYYVHGSDESGNVVSSKYDPALIRTTSVKMAYKLYGDAMQCDDVAKKKYLYAKSLIQAMYAYSFFKDKKQQFKPALFSVNKFVRWIDSKNDKNLSHIKKILQWKTDVCDDEEVTKEEQKNIQGMLELVQKLLERNHVSWRAWIIRCVFGFRQRRWKLLMPNYDKKVVLRMKNMINTNDFNNWEEVKKDVMFVLFV